MAIRKQLLLAALLFFAVSGTASADQWPVTGKPSSEGFVVETITGANLAVPVTAANPLSVTVVSGGSSDVGITAISSSAAEGSHILKASAGSLYSVYITAGASSGYLMVFNAVSAPADGAVTPVHCIPVDANKAAGLSFSLGTPGKFSTGITAVFSTTGCFTKTISATAFIVGSVL